MVDVTVDTQETPPVEGGKVKEPTTTEGIVDKVIDEAAKETTPTLTPDEIVEKSFQKVATWMGRRDSELLNKVSDIVNQRLATKETPPATSESEAEKLFDNPSQWLNQELSKREQRTERYTQAVISTAGKMMDADPLMADKEFGNEVVREIQRNFGSLDGRIPPNIAAKVLVNDSIANVYRQRANKGTNPLKGNKPADEPLGSISASGATKSSVVMPKISDMAKEYADKWGYKEEDLARIFGEG